MDGILASPAMPPRRERPLVLLYSKSFGGGIGGGELTGLEVAESFVSLGCDVKCVFHRQGSVKLATPKEIATNRIDPGGLLDFTVKAKPDLLFSRGSGVAVQSAHVAEKLGIPSVHYLQFWLDFLRYHEEPRLLHGGELCNVAFNDLVRKGRPAWDDLDESGLRAVANHNMVIANSYFTANVLRRMIGCEPLVAFPSGSKAAIAQDAPVYLEREYVLITSVQPLKGLYLFLKLSDHFPKQKFVALASPHEKAYNLNEIAACEQRPNVEVRDWTGDMASVYAGAKVVFIGTSTAETFSRVAVEARLSGCPVICTDNGNLPNIVLDRPLTFHDEYHEERRLLGKFDPPENKGMLGPGGVVVSQTADIDIWRDCLDQILSGHVKEDHDAFTDGFKLETPYSNSRPYSSALAKVLELIPRRRALMVAAGGPGVQSMCQNLSRTTGCAWATANTTAKLDTADYDLFILSGTIGQAFLQKIARNFPDRTVVSWCSHLSQMAFEPREIGEWMEITRRVCAGELLGMVTSYEDDAASYDGLFQSNDSFHWLPCTFSGEALIPSYYEPEPNNSMFSVAVLGPAHPRKNLLVALAAAARANAYLKISKWLLRSEQIDQFLAYLGCTFGSYDLPNAWAVRSMLETCDAVVHLSHSETFSYASIEALALGVPVIGPPSTPAHQYKSKILQDLLWVDPNSIEQVAGKIRGLAKQEDQDLVRRLCREHALDLIKRHRQLATQLIDRLLVAAALAARTHTLAREKGEAAADQPLFAGPSRPPKHRGGVRPQNIDPSHPASRRGRARYRP